MHQGGEDDIQQGPAQRTAAELHKPSDPDLHPQVNDVPWSALSHEQGVLLDLV